jgi:hypothetical protein
MKLRAGKSADPYDTANAFAGIALKTGPPIENEALKPAVGKTIVDIIGEKRQLAPTRLVAGVTAGRYAP